MGERTVLLLDEQSVAASKGVTFHLNPATKHPDNPVLLPGTPDEWDSLCVSWPGTVLYSPGERKFRCWYAAFDVIQTPDRKWNIGYAESDDGVHWRKPALGQVEFLGKPTNQVKADWPNTAFMSFAFENPLPGSPASQRYGCYWIESRQASKEGGGSTTMWSKNLAWSPDGMRWTRDCMAYGEKARAPFLDISQIVFDADEKDPAYRWKGYGQLFVARPDGSGWPGIRNIAMTHGASPAQMADEPHPIVLAPLEGVDNEIHFAAAKKIGGNYLMLFESDRFDRKPINGDLRLAVSSDGRNFRRVHANTPLVATGAKGMWDENLLVTNTAGWQEVGDEVWIHYFGCPRMYDHWPSQYAVSGERRGSMFAPVYLGLATLPRDRFGYATGEGTVTTHMGELSSEGVWVNADGEAIGVEAVDTSGSVVARGKLTGERSQSVYRKVVWEGTPPRGGVQLKISLNRGARLYGVRH